jgi:CspA family cold shock protein
MQNGVVKWFSDAKGFGFVSSQGKDYFIHFKEIQSEGFKSLKEGDQVRFTPTQSPKGPVATQLFQGHIENS